MEHGVIFCGTRGLLGTPLSGVRLVGATCAKRMDTSFFKSVVSWIPMKASIMMILAEKALDIKDWTSSDPNRLKATGRQYTEPLKLVVVNVMRRVCSYVSWACE